MALLVGFSMIAFIVADSINATNFPIFLGAILGALALWLLSGKGGGEGWLIAGVGAVLGAVVGLYGPGLIGDNTVAFTSKGNLSQEDIVGISNEQQTANNFLAHASKLVLDKLPQEQQASYRPPELFGYVNVADAATQRENAVMTYLFGQEADELGITLTDDAVRRFIVDVTQGKMTDADFKRIRTDMQIGTGELIGALRSQLRAREALRLLAPSPRTNPTPQQLWADYQKLSVEAGVSVAPIPAEAFLASVDDPSDDELVQFFDRYTSVPPGVGGTPGFLVPRQVQVASLEVSMADVRKSVTPPTDEEVRAFYDRNRSQFEFQPGSAPGTAPMGVGGTEAGNGIPAGGTPPVEAPRPTNTPSPMPEESAPALETPEDIAPEGDGANALLRDGTEFVAFQDEEAVGANAPVEAPKAAGAIAAPAADSAAPPAPSQPAPASPAEPSQAMLDAIREDLLNQRARQAADLKLEKVLEDVRELVLRIEESVPFPEDPEDPEQQKKFDDDRRASVKEVVAEMKKYAEANGLKYSMTPFLSGSELYESEDYPVGGTVRWEKDAPIFGRETTPIVDEFFRTSADQPLNPIPAQNPLNESRYVALKIADAPPRVPTLDEESVREKVVREWKLQQCRDLAKQRAEELSKQAASSKEPLATVLADETATGETGGQTLTVQQVGPFTWLRRSTTPGQGFQLPDIVPNDLPQLPGAGEAFMRTVFETLKVGESGVAASTDGSTYYVVEVESRSSTEEIAKMRDEFLKENPFFFLSPFRVRMSNEAFELRRTWYEAFRKRHDVVFPDAPSEAPAA
ncbi:MAG: hypothetical protein WBC44_09660 [Planctomycetaceae bacterium]